MMSPPANPAALPRSELEARYVALLGEPAKLQRLVAGQRNEIGLLKGLKGQPVINPSGMEDATEARRQAGQAPQVPFETQVLRAEVPSGHSVTETFPFYCERSAKANKAQSHA